MIRRPIKRAPAREREKITVKKYVLLFQNIEYGANASQAWHDWFSSVGPALIDAGNPFGEGHVVKATGSTVVPSDGPTLSGYSIVSVESFEDAERLAASVPPVSGVLVYEALPM